MDDGRNRATGGSEPRVPRCETREPTVRQVEYAPFPRIRRDEGWSRGFTRDVSRGGACLRTTAGVDAGSLLRVIVHRPDGSTDLDSVGRVVWCREGSDGECQMGVAWLASRPGVKRRAGSRPPGSGGSPA